MLLGHIKKKRQKTYNKHLFTIFMFKDKTGISRLLQSDNFPPPPPSRSVPTQCPVFSLSPCGPLWWWLCVNGLHWEVPLQRQPGGSTFYCCTFWHFKIAYRTTYFPNRASMAYHTWLHKPDTFFSTASEIDSLTRVTYM